MTEEAARKATVRRLALARRARVTAGERAAAGTAVAERIAALPELAPARSILGFASFGGELPTDEVMGWVLSSGRRLLVPFVDGSKLRAAAIASIDDLAPGYRGIREPVERTPVEASEADVVLVPGVAFDEAGRRLGYGGGFYDSFLAGIEPHVPRIGLCFEAQIVEEVPAGSRDERVDMVVTEKRVIHPQKPRKSP